MTAKGADGTWARSEKPSESRLGQLSASAWWKLASKVAWAVSDHAAKGPRGLCPPPTCTCEQCCCGCLVYPTC